MPDKTHRDPGSLTLAIQQQIETLAAQIIEEVTDIFEKNLTKQVALLHLEISQLKEENRQLRQQIADSA